MGKYLRKLAMLLTVGGCTTSQPLPQDGFNTLMGNPKAAGILDATHKQSFQFSASESAAIYESMTSAEKAVGEVISPNRMHSTAGIVTCHREGSIPACFFRTKMKNANGLSLRERIDRQTADKIWEFYLRIRADLSHEVLLAGDLVCDYVRKEGSPLDAEAITCKIAYPRLANEAIFIDATAENLALILAEERQLVDGISTVRGAILCQWIRGTERTPCVVRPMAMGILREKFIEVPSQYSAQIGPRLMATLRYDVSYRKDIKLEKVELPGEILGSITCLVDGTQRKESGRRKVICKVAI